MKKFFFSILSFTLIGATLIFFYLAFFGYETKRFNQTISDIVENNAKNVDLNFEKVKISLELKKLSVFINLIKPEIYYLKTPIPLDFLKADIDLFSFFTNKNSISEIIVDTKYINFNSIKPIILRSKPGNLKTILLNNVKDSKFKINSELKFDKNLQLTKESSLRGIVKETAINFNKMYPIRDTSFNFVYRDQLLNINNLQTKFADLEIFDSKIEYTNSHLHELNGDIFFNINSEGKNIKKILSWTKINLENFVFKSLIADGSSTFNLKLDKTLAVKETKYNVKTSVVELRTSLKKEINSKLFKQNIKNIHLKDSTLDVNNDNKNTIVKLKSFIKTSKEFYRLDVLRNVAKNSTNFLLKGKVPIKIPLINYALDSGEVILNGQYFKKKNKEIFFPEIKYKINDDFFEIKNLVLSNEFDLINFKEVNVKTKINENINNNFSIINSSKKKISIKGTSFDAKILSKELSKSSKNNFLKNISKTIEVDIDRIFTDTNFPLEKFRLIGDIKKGEFEKILGKSEFINGKYLDISLNKEKNSKFKILEIHSDIAKPLIKNYKFFDGLNQGDLIYESKFDDKSSTSVLKINNFKLIKAPAFAKLLTLADFQGLTDTLKGEGISFDTLVIKFTTDSKIMNIEEIFMIGPSISILIEGYVEQKSGLVSLRGTLVPAKTLNTLLSKIPVVGHILIGKKDGEGLFGVSFKMKGMQNNIKTTVNPVKTLTPRFITRALESLKRQKPK